MALKGRETEGEILFKFGQIRDRPRLPSAPDPRLRANEIVRVQGKKIGNPKNSLGHVERKRFGCAQTEIVTLRQSCCDASTTMHEMRKTNFELDLLNRPQFIDQSNNHSHLKITRACI